MRKRSETRPIVRMIGAYVDWRETCLVVHEAYRSWATATRPTADAVRWYRTALDAEERAAEVYARLVGRAGNLAMSDDNLAGPLAV